MTNPIQGREFDWRKFLNTFVYCYSCGRFGKSARGTNMPRNWKLLYQPHGDAPPGLHVCSETCADRVRSAMMEGPVREPLETGKPPMMDVEMREHMIGAAMQNAAVDQGRVGELKPEGKHAFRCHICDVRLDPEDRRLTEDGWRSRGIPVEFECPRCGAGYWTNPTGTPGKVKYGLMKEENGDDTVPGSRGEDSRRWNEARGPHGNGDDSNLRSSDEVRPEQGVPSPDDEEDVVEGDRGGAPVDPERLDGREGSPGPRGVDLG